ncbi:hypothetical protein Ga0466249_001246 [Sporomusaceae bacterium BoRhaA]|uniref:hypothetical protein n=1 Tax=Pelorhabdus rhamnosifermentans TaxID=2772457 RepID=UPI001C06075C|nr:hypothetical protein [Pelorhabdus rhamnosifermentans]MBU2700154.1 hypothetical protein [Pelorhabdus rhamnosifermentans]
MFENKQKPTLKGSIDSCNSFNCYTEPESCKSPIHTLPRTCNSCFLELPPIIIVQPCDTQPRIYWYATDKIDSFIWVVNKGCCIMKVLIAEAGCKPPLTDTILPGQAKLFSSNCFKKFAIECCECRPVKCLGMAKIIVKN